MPKASNLIGQVFNYLTVIEKTDKRKNGSIVWNCQCKCGNIKEATSSDLNAGRVQSCGCYNKERVAENGNNLLGKRYGRLVVIEKMDKRSKNRCIYWKCKCDCGNECEVIGSNLVKENGTRSCGCIQKEKTSILGKQKGIDLAGQRFGKLTVIKLLEDAKERTWECKCDCGNIRIVKAKYLLNEHVSSCGCLKQSLGELKIKQILKENNIDYIPQYHTDSCRFLDTNYYAYFDFYVDNKYIIEYDGVQHFSNQYFKNIKGVDANERFIKTKEHDKYKNQWCKKNNIPLIRIPYTHLKNLCLEDLLLETTKWKVEMENDL